MDDSESRKAPPQRSPEREGVVFDWFKILREPWCLGAFAPTLKLQRKHSGKNSRRNRAQFYELKGFELSPAKEYT